MKDHQFKVLMEKLDTIIGQLEQINNKTPLLSTIEYVEHLPAGQPMSVAICTCHLKGQGKCTVEIVCPEHG